MKSIFPIGTLLLLLSAVVWSQGVPIAPDTSRRTAAPDGWTLYRVSGADVAVMFPKLPVRVEWGDACGETRGSIYYVYANEAVYEMRFFAKDAALGKTCSARTPFGQETFDRRLSDLRGTRPAPVAETDGELGGRKVKIFKWETADEIAMRWVISDLGKDRWHEVALNYRTDVKPLEKSFLDSLVFSAANGTEILMGSASMPGDKDINLKPASGAALANLPLGFKSKPRPPYTEQARRNGTQGSVVLEIEFLANGAIGTINVKSGLADGLTEEAIAAARRIVFMPARTGGVPVRLVREVVYQFSLG